MKNTDDIILDEDTELVQEVDETAEIDTTSPDADAVRAFLEEERKEQQQTEAEKAETTDNNEGLGRPRTVDPEKEGSFSHTFTADTTFETNETEVYTKQYVVPVDDKDIPITPQDQAMYLKAVLNDVPLQLTQVLAEGRISITCRALSVYEQDLMLETAMFVCGGENGVTAMLPSIAQQLRVAMQTVDINGRSFPTVRMEPERNRRKEQMLELIKLTDDILAKVDAAKFGFLVRALNVFEYKIAQMNTLAYNGDFWNPAEID